MQSASILKNSGQERLHQLQQWNAAHPLPWQTIGLVTLAGVTGMAVGVIVAKGLLASKGLVAAGTVLSQQSGTVPGAAAILTSAATLPDKAVALLHLLTQNAAPLTAGAVGGGAAGVGAMQGQVRRTKKQLVEQMAQTATAQAATQEAQQALRQAEAQLSQLQNQAPVVTPAADALEQIQGIGPVFARRLHEAGITTLADLAAQTPAQVRAIVATVRGGKMINAQAWIDQARQLLDSPAQAAQTAAADTTAAV